MITKFIIKIEEFYKEDIYFQKSVYQKLIYSFNLDKEENEKYLIEKLDKINKEGFKFNEPSPYAITGFIRYLGENQDFKNIQIIKILKDLLSKEISSEKPSLYSYILTILTSVNKKDVDYYIEQYNLLKKSNKLFNDINASFLTVFINTNNEEYFLKIFPRVVIDDVSDYFSHYITEGFKYINTLKKNEFKRHLFTLLDYFKLTKNKEKLVKYHNYGGLVKDKDNKKIVKEINNLFKKIEEYKFNLSNVKKLYTFLVGDIKFALNNHERDLINNLFIDELSYYLFKKNKSLILNILKDLRGCKYIFGIESYIVKYLQVKDVEKFIKLLIGNEYENVIYYSYDHFIFSERKDKDKIIEQFKNSVIFGDKLLERNLAIEKNSQKSKNIKKDRNEKRKDTYFQMINPKGKTYYPKLFQDYVNDLTSEQGFGEFLSTKELDKIEKSLKKQIYTYLDGLSIKSFTKNKVSLLTFENKGDNKTTHTWHSVYLSWIIQISKNIDLDLKKYYKSFILFYPLLWGDNTTKDIFEIVGDKLESKDIYYILKTYNEDLHDQAIGLRYHNIQNLINFYEKFKEKFNNGHNKKIENIVLHLIENTEENIYLKEKILNIYAEVGGVKKYKLLWKERINKYKKFNYFKDYLVNDIKLSEKELNKMNLLVSINKILILKFQDKEGILWRIIQIQNGVIEGKERLEIKYPNTSASMSYIDKIESEIGRWGSDEDNFSFIFSKIPKVDIKKEIFELFKLSLDIKEELNSGKRKGDYILYSEYLKNIFYSYINNLDDTLIKKEDYYKIKKLSSKYDYEIIYNINLDKLREKFGIDSIDEEAIEIEKKGIQGIRKILKQRDEVTKVVYKEENLVEKKEGNSISLDVDKKQLIKDNKKLIKNNTTLEKLNNKLNDEKNVLKGSNIGLIERNKKLKNDIKELSDNYSKLEDDIEFRSELNKYDDISCILIVEGISDKTYLDYYYNHLASSPIKKPLIIKSTGGVRGVVSLLKHFEDYIPSIPVLGMFDFDYTGVKEGYFELNEYENIEGNNPFNCLCKKNKNLNIYAFLLPVPEGNEIEKQVIKNKPKLEALQGDAVQELKIDTFEEESKLEIEHLLYNVLEGVNKEDNEKMNKYLFEEEKVYGGGEYKKLKGNFKKLNFSKDLINGKFFGNKTDIYRNKLFTNFEPIFKLIENISK